MFMAMNLSLWTTIGVLGTVGLALAGCDREYAHDDSTAVASADSMGVAPSNVSTVTVRSKRNLVESSSATMSATQPGVLFTINDSGNEAILYLIDTTGADRGAWRVLGATDIDWEATAIGPCSRDARPKCVYIGDTGDNDVGLQSRVIYRVPEPDARDSSYTGELRAERLTYRYPDRGHDVEAMYVAAGGDIYLITKRPLRTLTRRLRPALVFRLPPSAWNAKAAAIAQLVDSLDLVPGSSPLRLITDAALSRDGRHLAVRTYSQVYIYSVDSATSRIDHAVKPSICNIVSLSEPQGEGITWATDGGRLVFSSEGHDAALHLANCPVSGGR
jgi:hypothetical protein